jgi:hypothetical protein
MTSAGEPGRVNVSDSVFQRVKGLFDLEERGSIEAKNKGLLEMSFLTGIKPELSGDGGRTPNAAFHQECTRLFSGYAPAA